MKPKRKFIIHHFECQELLAGTWHDFRNILAWSFPPSLTGGLKFGAKMEKS